ncbi:MAG: alpha/beta fold hydrolase [Ectothiorhodospiraceae bacterium]|nr:alpha/beta fold hydrolase [Ectothiorhodospiraceae bacterium]
MDETVLQTREESPSAPDGARFRVTHVRGEHADKPPVVYLPGMFTGRNFWLSSRSVGLAAYLAHHGFPGLVVERRRTGCGGRPGLEDHLTQDLPLVQALVERTWKQPAFWMGHSFGGVLAARAAAGNPDQSRILGLVLFAAQFEVGKRGLHPPVSWLTSLVSHRLGRFPARRLGLGPVDEPPEAMDDAIRQVTEGRRKPDIRESLHRITVPVLAISGLGDKVDPTAGCERLVAHFASKDKRFIRAGRKTGFLQDYDHPGIVVSKPAQQEIWPLVLDWLVHRIPAS